MEQHNNLLRASRKTFYQSIRNHQSIIEWNMVQSPQNHLDFCYKGYKGHVNWYYRDVEIQKYGGNVCVTFKTNPTSIPAEFHVHPYHQNWILASEDFLEVNEAVEWALEKILLV